MPLSKRYSCLLFCLLLSLPFAGFTQKSPVLKGQFWKNQALESIIPAWQAHVFNEADGGFYAHLKQDWTPYQNEQQYPGMIARQLFSFSAAYLLSGDAEYLKLADSTFQYLVKHGWDKEYGGWYERIGPHGEVTKDKKDLFMQTYAITGLTLYYATTHNPMAKTYLERSYALLRQHAWDRKNQGYYDALDRSLSVADTQKGFSPQLAPASGFLTYLYPVTGQSKYKAHFQTLLDMAWEKMRHPEKPWIMESFTRDWQLIKGRNNAMNVGHNLEVVWLLLRLYHFTDDSAYRQKALKLNGPLTRQAFDSTTGAWYHKLPVNTSQKAEREASWWVQAYANMTQLYLYRVTGYDRYLKRFRKGAGFWNRVFVDNKNGGTILKATFHGSVQKGAKAVRTKTAYHAMEHALLNYLYVRLWVQEKPVNLHYRLDPSQHGQTFRPVFMADPSVSVKAVRINGKAWQQFDAEQQTIQLPRNGPVKVRVTLQ